MNKTVKKVLITSFIVISILIAAAVGAILGSLDEIRDNFFDWLGDREGAYRNETESLEHWLNSITDKEFNFSGQVINKEKFKMYLQYEKTTYFNDLYLKVPVYVNGSHIGDEGYTLALYNSTFQYKMPWQIIAGIDMILGQSDNKKTKYLDKMKKLFIIEYYGLTNSSDRTREVSQNSNFRFYKTVEKTVFGDDDSKDKVTVIKYPLPYFTKIKTPFSTYEFIYETKKTVQKSETSSGKIISQTVTTEPILVDTKITDNPNDFIQKIMQMGLKISDIEDLVEFISHMPYGEQALPLLTRSEFGIDSGYGGGLYYSPGDINYSDGILLWPVPKSSKISSPFGYRVHPISGVKKMHKGIDIPGSTGYDILAADNGKVIRVANDAKGYGYWIEIQHTNNMTTRYAHLSKQLVKVGQEIKKGELIAKMGSTGASTGPHLHFEVRIKDIPQDPAKFVGVQSNVIGVVPEMLAYKEIDVNKAVAYLSKKNSYIDSKEDVLKIVKAGKDRNINPLLLIAITGQEMSYIKDDYKYWARVYGESNLLKKLKGISSSATLQDAPMYISNNPFNVYNAWWKKQPGLEESARVASNTIIKLSANRPNNIDPLKWMNMPKGVNPKGYYASDPAWNIGVKKHLEQLLRDVGYK